MEQTKFVVFVFKYCEMFKYLTNPLLFFPLSFSVAAGTGQGFALLDYAQKKEVATRCTLNPNGN